jgi:iron complex transport system substrate-binding protein
MYVYNTPVHMRLPLWALAALVLVAVSAACSAAPAAQQEPAGATRVVVQPEGDVVVPAEPERMLVLDEYSALELLAIGVRPALVFATLRSPIARTVLDQERIPVQDEPTFLAEPNLEAVAAAAPDVIVISGASPLARMLDGLNAVAPTVVVPYSRPWRDVLAATAAAFGREEAAAAVVAHVDERVAELRERVVARPLSVSVVLGWDGGIFTPTRATPVAALLEEAGIGRPDVQRDPPAQGDPTISGVSPEDVAAHDAAVVAVLAGGYYDAATVRTVPTFAPLAGHAVDVDGDTWLGSHPFAISWILDDLTGLADGTDQVGTVADAAGRWTAFSAATAG